MLVISREKFEKSIEWYLARTKSQRGILITENGEPKWVLITAEEYDRLRGVSTTYGKGKK